MRLLLCYLCPPAAVLLCGRPFSMILNCMLTCWFWIPGVKHALTVYADWKIEFHHQSMMGGINSPRWARDMLGQSEPEPQQPQVIYVQPPAQLPAAPAPARRSRRKEPEPLIDDPTIGAHGTVFRRREA